MTVILIVLAILVLAVGVPIGYWLGVVSIPGLWDMGGWSFLRILATRYHSSVEEFLLIAVPFFILAGELMNRSGLTDRLLRWVNLLLGHFPGGLSHVTIGGSIVFAGMTGAAVTDCVAIGNILIPGMKKEGYPSAYAAAVTAAASIIGPIIPPSIIMIVYGHLTGMSVISLFAAGILPGLLMGLCLIAWSVIASIRGNFPRRAKRANMGELLHGTFEAALALFTPIIILGSILAGIATVTESAAVAVGYVFIVGRFVFRTLKFRDLLPSALVTARLTGVIFLLLATAHTFGWFITRVGVPDKVNLLIHSITNEPMLILLFINFFLLVVGMFMDILPATMILVPVLTPTALNAGIDPLHFALVLMVNLNIGMITPPYGMTLLTATRIAGCTYDESIRAVIPFLAAELFTLGLITYFPWFVLIVPRALGLYG
jgi:tripartite ATP-independent transporter DctM subunit